MINLHKSTEPFEFDDSNRFGYEKSSVLEAFRVLSKEGYYITISGHDYDMRKKRLEKEYEENTKSPGPVEEQPKEGNPALEEAASQFNDALLNEQAKEIERLKNENEDWKSWHEMQNRQIALSNIAFRNEKNRLGKEIARLNKVIHKKNEDLRLTKIREKNLAELGLKYVVENEKLKNELAGKVVDKIDAHALKSAESALAWKEKTITYKDMALAYYEKKIAEKDEVIAELREKLKSINMNRHNERICKKQLAEKDEVISDLGNELAATKKELEEKTQLVETVRKGSKEYCEYGIAAEKMIQKMAKEIVNDSPVPSKDYKQYRRWANGYRFNPQLYDFIEEEEKKLEHAKKIRVSSDNAEEGTDLSGVIVLCGKDYIDALKKAEDADIWQE